MNATIDGRITCKESIREARARGNDSVIIASSASSHYELLMLALENKLPIFCEKPMVLSVEQAADVELAWIQADRPPFLCDFVHLWSRGFEYAWPRYKARSGVVNVNGELLPTPKFGAVFGGNVRRKDVHPVWDYGAHPISMALMLGVDLRGLKCEPCVDCDSEWNLSNEHCSIHVRAGPFDSPLPQKYARAWLGNLFALEDGTWNFPRREPVQVFHNDDDPPLQRALNWFVNSSHGAWQSASVVRDGVLLPVQVTNILESCCPSESPFK